MGLNVSVRGCPFARVAKLCRTLCFSLLLLPFMANADSDSWQEWLIKQLQQHPQMISAQQQYQAAQAKSDAARRPIYNPELSSEYERTGDSNNFRIGVSQSIDVWDKKSAYAQQAALEEAVAIAAYEQRLQSLFAEALTAVANWQAAKAQLVLITEQQQRLDRLMSLLNKQQQAGELSSLDAELTFFALSEGIARVASAKAELHKAELAILSLLPEWKPSSSLVPANYWQLRDGALSAPDLHRHPLVKLAKARWQLSQQQVELTRLNAKSEPTVEFSGGRDDGNNLVGLSLSVPLNLRNNFSDDIRASQHLGLQAEADYQAAFREKKLAFAQADIIWQSLYNQQQQWQSQAQSRIENAAGIFELQWQQHDLSTKDYLHALNQRANSLLSAIKLQQQTRLAFIQRQLQAGQLNLTYNILLN